MGIKFTKGDLVRWITGHSVYEAHDDRLVGAMPIYNYGIVIEVSKKDPSAIIVNSFFKSNLVKLTILNGEQDDIEVLSSGASKNG